MQVLKPLPCYPSMLVSSNAVESYPTWAVGTTYAKDDIVVYETGLYQSLTNSNVGNTPSIDTVNWVYYGASNTCAMFDGQVSTQTVSTTPLTVTVAPGNYYNSVALLNLNAISATVTVTAGAETLFDETYALDETIIVDWYQYFFEPYALKTSLIIDNIPPSLSAVLTVSLSNTTGLAVKIGEMKFGSIYTLGDSEYGASLGIIDYSVKETDSFGVTTFVERSFSKKLSTSVFCLNENLTYITSVLQSLRATPTVWVYSDQQQFSPTIVYGYARDWSIDIAYQNHSLLSIEIEGLT